MSKQIKIPNYPIREDGRNIFAHYPLQVTQEMIDYHIKHDHPTASEWKVGDQVAVAVRDNGYFVLPNVTPGLTFEECAKGCAIHNEFYDFNVNYVLLIVTVSMHNSADR